MAFAVILGAGRPVRGQQPAALLGIAGQGRVLDWQVRALQAHCDDLLFVGGYRFEEIVALYPALPAVINPHWARTGPVASLLRAGRLPDGDCLVSYADILYRDDLVRRLFSPAADAVIAVDSCWRRRYGGRSAADLASAEVLTLDGDRLRRAHGRLDDRPAAPDAELVGLVRFGPRAQALLQSWRARPDLQRWDLPQLLNALWAEGLDLATVDCEGDWAELNAPQDLARFILGTKAQTLARLRPMVRHCHIGDQVAFTAGQWRQDPSDCLRRVQAAFGGHRLAVRSSALGEDGFAASSAGRFDSRLHVDGASPLHITQAVAQVLASYGDDNPAHQILVQRMVADIRLSGVVMTRTLSHGAPYRVINYDETPDAADTVTSGRGSTLRTLYIHRDSHRLPADSPAALEALLPAVREIEGLVGHDSLDIEFIVCLPDTVHILQIRPIAVDHTGWPGSDELVRQALAAARRDFVQLQQPGPFVLGRRALFSVMTDWNPAEMIGIRPRRLALSIYADLITRDTWALQRQQYGYRSLAPQALMQTFAGQAYIDIRASLNSFVPAELDDRLAERLVEQGIAQLIAQPQLHDKVEFEVAFSCLALDFEPRTRRLREAGFTADELQQLHGALARLTRRGVERIAQDLAAVDTLAQRQRRMDAAALPPLRHALLLLDDCRSHGTLPFAHLARAGFIAMAWLKSAVDGGVISATERAAWLQSVATVAGDYRDDCRRLQAGTLDLDAFLARYGHLRPGTYDITAASYADDPARYLDTPASAVARPAAPPQPTGAPWSEVVCARFERALAAAGLDIGFEQAERFMRQAIAGRELGKFVFTRSLSHALDALARHGASLGLSRDDLSHLSLADLRALDAGWLGGDPAALLRARVEEGRLADALALGIELPPLLLCEDDFSSFRHPDTEPNFIGSAAVTADVVCIDAVSAVPTGLAGRIALARQADPGYDWLFAQGIAGLVTAYGGANSHMAVRAAEFGLPAAIGVGELRFQQLAGCTRLQLDCGQRLLRALH